MTEDLLRDCNEHGVPVKDFRNTFCVHCRNPSCIAAGKQYDPLLERQQNWHKKYFETPLADASSSRYEHLRAADFEPLVRQVLVTPTLSRGTPTEENWAPRKFVSAASGAGTVEVVPVGASVKMPR